MVQVLHCIDKWGVEEEGGIWYEAYRCLVSETLVHRLAVVKGHIRQKPFESI